MKSAPNTVNRIENQAGKIVQLENESLCRSNELLQQLSELVDGLVSLSAPSRYSSAEISESDHWASSEYGNKLLAVTEAWSSDHRVSASR